MKKSLLLLFAAALTSASVSSQVTGVSIEPFFVHDGSVNGVPAGLTTYRIYAECTNPGDLVISVAGFNAAPLALNVPDGIWNANEPSSALGHENNCNLYVAIPSLQYDSYVTIGRSCNNDPGAAIFASQDASAPWQANFDTAPFGDGNILLNTTIGGAWNSIPTTGGNPNANVIAGDDLRVLIAQITTSGSICGSFNVQCRPQGQTTATLYTSLDFGTEGCGEPGCTDPDALNFNPDAGFNDGTCLMPCALEFVEINATNPTCFGSGNGSINAILEGNQDVLEISFNGAAPAANSGNFTASNLDEGIYSVLARDRKFYNEIFNPGGLYGLCEVEEFVDLFTIPIEFEATSVTNVTCGGDNDGCAVIPFFGGIGTPTFSIFQANGTLVEQGLPSSEYCGLAGGSYYFVGVDENGCETQSNNFNVVSPPQLILFLGAAAPATCFNSPDATQVFTWSGGTGDVDWSLEDDGSYEFEGNVSNLVLNDLVPGQYTMYAADVNGCSSSINFTVNGGPVINIESIITAPSCTNNTDASFVVNATGGTGAILYDLGCTGEGYSENNVLENLGAGVYTVCVQDAQGCNAVADIVISDPQELSVDFSAEQISCFGLTDGSITVNPTGGTGDYTYSLDGENYVNSNIFENLEAGTYDMYVQDGNGCLIQVIGSLVIVEPTQLTVQVDDFGGDGGNGTGFISITADGGTAPYSYDWSGPNNYTSTDEDVIDLGSGNYSVIVTDANGCQSETASSEITNVAEFANGVSLSINPNPTNAEFRLNITGLTGDKLTYTIMDGQGRKVMIKELGNANGSRSEVVDVRPLAAGIYYVNVQVGNDTATLKLIKQ